MLRSRGVTKRGEILQIRVMKACRQSVLPILGILLGAVFCVSWTIQFISYASQSSCNCTVLHFAPEAARFPQNATVNVYLDTTSGFTDNELQWIKDGLEDWNDEPNNPGVDTTSYLLRRRRQLVGTIRSLRLIKIHIIPQAPPKQICVVALVRTASPFSARWSFIRVFEMYMRRQGRVLLGKTRGTKAATA